MTVEQPGPILAGAKALVTGIANEHSIAYGCAKAFREVGADLAITYANEKAKRLCRGKNREASQTDMRVQLMLRGRRIGLQRTDAFREHTSSALSRSCASVRCLPEEFGHSGNS